MPEERGGKPTSVGEALASYLEQAGLAARIEQAAVIPEWGALVGERIAAVTEPYGISADGTLMVVVATSAWMQELSLLEPEVLERLNQVTGRQPITRIRWLLRREPKGRGSR